MTAAGHSSAAGASAVAPMEDRMSPVVAAEVALAVLSLAAIAGFARLYRDASFFVPLAVLAVAGHGLAAVCRRRRLPAPAVAAIAVMAGAVLIVWLFFGHTTVLGVPTFHTFDVADSALRRAWGRFGVVVAPAPVLPGFQLAAAVAVWAGIWFADWAAFRLWASAESIAPATVFFVFGSMLGAPRHRVWTTVVFAAAALAFMLAHRVARQEGTSTWVASAPGAGRRSLMKAGVALGSIAVLGGVTLGPQVPGAKAKPLLSWRQGQGRNGSRITVSPLVDIRKRLVDQSDREAFNVRSTEPAYWRLTSLDTFDGRIWSSGGSFSEANGRLPRTDPELTDPRTVTQEFQIGALDAIWAPAAFEASSVDPGDSRMRWDDASATLIVDDDQTTSDGLLYTVESDVPRFSKADLKRAQGAIPSAISKTYLRLPDDFNRTAAELAKSVTRTGANAYDRAKLLQDWFRDKFTYDLSVPPGHSEDAIADFLSTKRGYCEQFAGTYAAMARSIGLPSRLAVGFTPGDTDPSDPELYHVKGKHAHAWPEVWIGTIGWVAFEPTPGRGAPGAEAYTGVRPQQARSTQGSGAATTEPATTVGPSVPPSGPKLNPDRFNIDVGNGAGGGRGAHGALDNPLVLVVIALLAGGTAYVALALVVPWMRRRRARAQAVTPADRVALAWSEASEVVARNGSTLPFSSETHHEYASRVAPVIGSSAAAHGELASLVSASTWSAAPPDEPSVARAESLSRQLSHQMDHRGTSRERLRRRLDPRRLATPKPATRGPSRKHESSHRAPRGAGEGHSRRKRSRMRWPVEPK